jgi:DNA-binding Xre family transcriptional regulator
VGKPDPNLLARANYQHRRIMERIGMDLDEAMRKKGLTLADVAKATRLTRECVATIVDGTAEDIDIRTLVDVFFACDHRVLPEITRTRPVSQAAEAW